MGKKRLILLAVLLIAMVGGVGWRLLKAPQVPDPIYKGQPLSYWLDGFYADSFDAKKYPGLSVPTRQEAGDAVIHLGTNAIPMLLRMLGKPIPSLADRFLRLAKKQSLIKIKHIPADSNWKAYEAFSYLAATARIAVPQLIQMDDTDASPFIQQAVPAILSRIGTPAEPAIPALLRWINHTNEWVRNNVVYALGQIHSEPTLVVPLLIKCLNDTNAAVRGQAASALGEFHGYARPAVPALIALRDQEPSNSIAVSGLARGISTHVRTSSSWIRLSDSNVHPDVLGRVTAALRKIDPAAASNLGKK
jgi:HEAT repeat protein